MIWVTLYTLSPSFSAISSGRRPCSLYSSASLCCDRLHGWRTTLGAAGRCRGLHGRAERPAALVVVLAAGEFFLGLLVQDHVLLGRLVHPDRDHRQALRVLFLALTRHAVVVLLRPLGMELPPAGYALLHSFRKTVLMLRLFPGDGFGSVSRTDSW